MSTDFLHGVEVTEIDDGSRVITIASSSVIGIVGTAPNADATAFPLNTPVLVTSRADYAKLTASTTSTDNGTLPQALKDIYDETKPVCVVVRVDVATDAAAQRALIIGGQDANGNYTGANAFIGAEHITGSKPRIFIAPGFTHERPLDTQGTPTSNPVVAALITIAERLRAIIIQDGPNTNDADAKLMATDFDSRRVFLVDPQIDTTDAGGNVITTYASPKVAALIAKTDNNLGFWWSPSNQVFNGVTGTSRVVDFVLGDTSSRANLLNAANVATIIRQNGYRLWGNRTLSSDTKWAFLCVVRTSDIINDSLQAAHLWAVDRGITKNYVNDVIEGVNAFLRNLVARGAILGGSCWADPGLNTADQIAAGHIYFDFDFTPVYPAERVTFRSHLVNDYIASIFSTTDA